jgi:hypothetical protein
MWTQSVHLSESNPFICRNSVASDSFWPSLCSVSLDIPQTASFVVGCISRILTSCCSFPPVYTVLPSRFVVTQLSQEQDYQPPLHRVYLIRPKTRCLFHEAHRPLPIVVEYFTYLAVRSACYNLRAVMWKK